MQNFEFYHGAAIIKIIRSGDFKQIETFGRSNSSYLLDEKIGLYIKYCKNRMSPWIFTFDNEHVNEVKEIFCLLENVFVALVCKDNGICCLNWLEFNTVISVESSNYPKWIKASRKKNEKYSVSGTDGNLKRKIGNSDFPSKLKENIHII
ncbi:MAG: hypothetical protein PHW73_05595 [Atribacterota bacterium]|nr:hypothetical protein [Atribacterota bacterium]